MTTPACCICDPTKCAADDTGEHCNTQSCGSCLHGCPAPEGTCCPTVRTDNLEELAAWYATNAVTQAHTAYQQERAARQDVERQLTAATDALLTDLADITPEDFR